MRCWYCDEELTTDSNAFNQAICDRCGEVRCLHDVLECEVEGDEYCRYLCSTCREELASKIMVTYRPCEL